MGAKIVAGNPEQGAKQKLPSKKVEQAKYEDKDSDHGSAAAPKKYGVEAFYANLKKRLNKTGIHYDRLPTKLAFGVSPPCFELKGSSYKAWLEEASKLSIPYRLDMPAEPNYCIDCTAKFKEEATLAGACIFPNTKFVKTTTVFSGAPETEVIGVGKPPRVLPDGMRYFRRIVVSEESFHPGVGQWQKKKNRYSTTSKLDFNEEGDSEAN